MIQLLAFDFLTRTVPSSAVKCACWEFMTPDLAGPAAPATVSRILVPKALAALIPFSVNCGKARRMPPKKISSPANMTRATLRYVTVFHAMWIPGLRFEDTKATQKPS